MHIKLRRGRALLYRSAWVPRGAQGNSNGYTRQVYVGSIAADATIVPAELLGRLVGDELNFLEERICKPARDRIADQAREAARRERDPAWRVAEATRLVDEAIERSAAQPLAAVTVTRLRETLDRLRVAGDQPKPRTTPVTDQLADALSAVRAATQAVAGGRYGKAPAEQVRNTRTYRMWAELFELVQGESETSLLRALQAKGFVKKRGG
ncbi:hypothetical protein [Thiomonas sp. FB-6]|uniref:hypothetical protein n=1 Tax=Thiomonas sp. FB-6 TaxID=1158291 RepID=UPI000364FA86|nr:hypothetical protein [Thiomonas sp. FB-6]